MFAERGLFSNENVVLFVGVCRKRAISKKNVVLSFGVWCLKIAPFLQPATNSTHFTLKIAPFLQISTNGTFFFENRHYFFIKIDMPTFGHSAPRYTSLQVDNETIAATYMELSIRDGIITRSLHSASN